MVKQDYHIIMYSGGKDSGATVILAHLNNEPVDEIIFCETMFDKDISGENFEHIEFVYNVAKPLFESWGYKFTILRSEKTYLDVFNNIITKSKIPERNGRKKGFPLSGKCAVLSNCKLAAISKFETKLKKQYNVISYIGYATNETKRLHNLNEKKISLLIKYGYDEKMAKELCKEYGLLSQTYNYSNRGGCWFCPNARDSELRNLFFNHRELFDKLVELEKADDNKVGHCWNILTGVRIQDKQKQFENEIMFEWGRR